MEREDPSECRRAEKEALTTEDYYTMVPNANYRKSQNV